MISNYYVPRMGELPRVVVPFGAVQYNEQVLSHEPIMANSEQKQV